MEKNKIKSLANELMNIAGNEETYQPIMTMVARYITDRYTKKKNVDLFLKTIGLKKGTQAYKILNYMVHNLDEWVDSSTFRKKGLFNTGFFDGNEAGPMLSMLKTFGFLQSKDIKIEKKHVKHHKMYRIKLKYLDEIIETINEGGKLSYKLIR